MSLSRQGSAEAADPSSALFQPSLIPPHPQQTSFIMASPGQPLPASSYPAPSHAPPAQQGPPAQSFMQPPQQVSGWLGLWHLPGLLRRHWSGGAES